MRFTSAVANILLDDIAALAAGGWMRLYDCARPASVADTPAGPACGEIRLAAPAFAAPSNGTMALAPIVSSDVLVGGVTPVWFRLLAADGATIIGDGTVGAGGDLTIAGALSLGMVIDASGVSLALVG